MDFRACFTVPSGRRKAKVWFRHNFKNPQTSKEVVSDFYDWSQDGEGAVLEQCAKFYIGQLSRLDIICGPRASYRITIRVVSSSSSHIPNVLSESGVFESRPARKKARELLIDELAPECGLPIRNANRGERTKLVGFQYPAKNPAWNADPFLEATGNGGGVFQALCIVDHNEESLDIAGVAHEPKLPSDFRRSAPHVVSGEISFEVGNAY